ncbi:MAG TPA: type III pantothenate kinase [Pyrinomonadaceae bacterium]|nr:type III pantothenate kinase [Pyrinomonadaceae bacterium]
MLLAIDAGNTAVKLGVFRGPELQTSWRLNRDKLRTDDEYGIQLRTLFEIAGLNPKDVEAIIISSVVPDLNYTLQWMSERFFNITPIFVDHTTDTGLQILYDRPAELGTDRLVDAVAAVEKYGAPCIVIDFGTATTFNAINSKREYLGGIIVPGIMTAADALVERTAKLPRVDFERPPKVIGSSTTGALQSGMFYGTVSMVDGLIEQICEAMGSSPKVIATGGLGPLMGHASEYIDTLDETLTLDGLRIIYERNKRV